jgi:hypothetical protein
VRRFDLLEQAARRAGAKKILFGSDGPWLHPGIELAKARALGFPAADEKLILGQNLLRLISRVKRRGGGGEIPSFKPAPALPLERGDPWAAAQFPAGRSVFNSSVHSHDARRGASGARDR